MSRRTLLTVSLIALLTGLVAAPIFAGGAVGAWKLEYQGRQGPAEATLAIKEVDGALQGTWTDQRGETPLTNVQFKDGELTFKRTVSTERGEFELDFVGKIDGDSLDGKQVTPRGETPVKGTRTDS